MILSKCADKLRISRKKVKNFNKFDEFLNKIAKIKNEELRS